MIDFAKEARDLKVSIELNCYPAADGTADLNNDCLPIIETTLRAIAERAADAARKDAKAPPGFDEVTITGLLAACDWPSPLPAMALFEFYDDPGEHDPCYVIMPGGSMLALNHHAVNGVDQARARFIVAACNDLLLRLLRRECDEEESDG
jgi:hypothetical protein